MEFKINTGPTDHPFGAAAFTNLDCNYSISYTVKYVLNGVEVTPAFIVFDAINRKLTVSATNPGDPGNYIVTVTATIPQPSEPSGDLKVSTAFILKVG